MNGQELGSHRRLSAPKTLSALQRLSNQTSGLTTRVYFDAQKAKNIQTSQPESRSLGALWPGKAESLLLFQKPKKGEHRPLYSGLAGEGRAEGFSSLLLREMSDFAKSLELGTRKGSLKKEAWSEKTPETTAPIGIQGKGWKMAFSNQVNNQGEKPQGQCHKDLWKDLVIRYSTESPGRGLQMLSQGPKLITDFDGHIVEGRKIHLKSRPPGQGMVSASSLEETQKEEIQTSKKKKVKDERAKEREAQYQFAREKSFLQRKLCELGSVPVGGESWLDKEKAQASRLSPKDHHLKSGPRAHTGNALVLGDNSKEAKRTKKRNLRIEWWDPTVWGASVTLAKREQSPLKTFSKSHGDSRRLHFPIGHLSYADTNFMHAE